MTEAAPDPSREVDLALQDFDSADAALRAAARDRLRRLGSEAVLPLVRIREQEAWREQNAIVFDLFSKYFDSAASYFVVSGVLVMFALAFFASGGSFLFVITTGIIFVVAMFAFDRRLQLKTRDGTRFAQPRASRRKLADQALASLDSIGCIGKLAEQIGLDSSRQSDKGLPEPFAKSLARIVPNATSLDLSTLTEEQQRRLFGTLDMYNSLGHPDLVIAVINLVERCRLVDEIPRIRSMAESGAASANGMRVRTAAREALARLVSIEEEMKDSRTLLRASDYAGEPSETLLRPAGHSEEDGGALLRPAENG